MLSVFYTGRGFSLTGGGDAVLHFAPAKIELGGKVRTLDAAADGHTMVSAGHGLRVTDTVAVCVRSVEAKVTVADRGSVCGFTSAVMRICWT